MDDKKALESFRVLQHGQPHPALSASLGAMRRAADPARAQAASAQAADSSRVVIHFDVDAFYAQCEMIRNPVLRDRPMGVTQKYLIVTSNYAARAVGVTKLMGITEAKQKCPDLVLVNGEDLTPYRQASKRIMAVLQRFGVAERGGMDEVFVDVSQEVQSRLAKGVAEPGWCGHVHSGKDALVADNKHRPMDLRVDSRAGAPGQYAAAGPGDAAAWEAMLKVGSAIAAEARAAVKAEAGFRSSAGIACNRMLAKMVSGLHKPDDQTILPPPEAADFIAPLPVRALPGVGWKMNTQLTGMGVETVAELRGVARPVLVQAFGERTAAFLFAGCRGLDSTPVQASGPPKSITVEDSFKSCNSHAAACQVLRVLAPDLVQRLAEEFGDTGRRAQTLTLKWRLRGQGWTRTSASCPMPSALGFGRQASLLGNPAQPDGDPQATAATALVTAATSLLKGNLSEPFQLTLLNIGATNFQETGKNGLGFRQLFARHQKAQASQQGPQPLGNAGSSGSSHPDPHSAASASVAQRRDYGSNPHSLMSKSLERALRENSKAASPPIQSTSAPAAFLSRSASIQAVPAPGGPVYSQQPIHSMHSMVTAPMQQQPGIHQASCQQALEASAYSVLPSSSQGHYASRCQGNPGSIQGNMTHLAQTGSLPSQAAGQRTHAAWGGDDEEDEQPSDHEHDAFWADLRRTASDSKAPVSAGLLAGRAHSHSSLLSYGSSGGSGPSLAQSYLNAPPPAAAQGAGLRGAFGGHQASAETGQPRGLVGPSARGSSTGIPQPELPASQPAVRAGQPHRQAQVAAQNHTTFHGSQSKDGEQGHMQRPSVSGSDAHAAEADGEAEGRVAPLDCEADTRVIIHCDLDCYYCQVERLDDPSLVERPLVVQQFNAGGFVAVSYEARAAGVRCGDGVGAGGRSNIKWLQEVGAVSMEEAKRRCPGLVVRPMRTERYRQVAGQVHDLLRRFTPAGLVEKASYDDFYLDVSAHCQAGPLVHADADGQAPAGLQVVAGLPWEQLGPSLQKGAQIAVEVRHALKAELGLTASCGLAHNKLLARLAGPLHKPDGCTALPHSAACEFIHGFRIKDIPNFRAKLGDEVTAKLGIETVGELAGFEASHMARLFGPQTGETLAGLALGLDPSPVRDRGPPKSLTCERSFPPLTTQEAVRAALEPLAASLWSRLLEDLGVHGRLPTKLTLAVRQGYNAVRSRSTNMPAGVCRVLRQHGTASSAGSAPPQPGDALGSAAAAARASTAAADASNEHDQLDSPADCTRREQSGLGSSPANSHEPLACQRAAREQACNCSNEIAVFTDQPAQISGLAGAAPVTGGGGSRSLAGHQDAAAHPSTEAAAVALAASSGEAQRMGQNTLPPLLLSEDARQVCGLLVSSALSLLGSFIALPYLQVTRLALGAAFDSSKGGAGAAAQSAAQHGSMRAFLQPVAAAAEAEGPVPHCQPADAAMEAHAAASFDQDSHQQLDVSADHRQHSLTVQEAANDLHSQGRRAASPLQADPSPPRTCQITTSQPSKAQTSRSQSQRDVAEDVAQLQRLFGKQSASGQLPSSILLSSLADGLSQSERDSLALAARLQQEELRLLMRAPSPAGQQPAAKKAKTGGAKVSRGPMDLFLQQRSKG